MAISNFDRFIITQTFEGGFCNVVGGGDVDLIHVQLN
jgi:hypothetical protein